jgi:hypothetical protein
LGMYFEYFFYRVVQNSEYFLYRVKPKPPIYCSKYAYIIAAPVPLHVPQPVQYIRISK